MPGSHAWPSRLLSDTVACAESRLAAAAPHTPECAAGRHHVNATPADGSLYGANEQCRRACTHSESQKAIQGHPCTPDPAGTWVSSWRHSWLVCLPELLVCCFCMASACCAADRKSLHHSLRGTSIGQHYQSTSIAVCQ